MEYITRVDKLDDNKINSLLSSFLGRNVLHQEMQCYIPYIGPFFIKEPWPTKHIVERKQIAPKAYTKRREPS